MIKTELIEVNGRQFIRSWSDTGHYLVRDGDEYGEALDPVGTNRVYTEGRKLEDSIHDEVV